MDDGMKILKVHKFLERELESFTSEEILKATGIDIENSPVIFNSLTGDASKVLREKDGRWRWASKYQLTNLNHLISLIARSPDGVCEKDLYDSYKGVKDDIKKLKAKRAVHEIKNGSRVLLFPRNAQLSVPISDELKQKYRSIILPEDDIEVHRYLVARNLKKTDDINGVKISQPVARKRPSRRNDRKKAKKIKLTNTHLDGSGIDLSKDYNTGKDSAFG